MEPINHQDALQPARSQVGFNAMACPTEEQLVGYRMGLCDAAESVRIESHVQSCDLCRTWCAELDSNDDILGDVCHALDDEARDRDKTMIVASGASSAPSADGSGDAPEIEGYSIIRELGRGGMGAVYLARQESTKREVALKVLLQGPFASTTAKRRFEREVELAAQLDHPNIVTILDSGITSGRYYCAMRNIEGRRLDHYIAGHKLSPQDILTLFLKICRAINHAHQKGVIHRDLKPSNILVDDKGEPFILDFGLAKPTETSSMSDIDQTQISMTGQIMGTLPYMSPEQTTGRQQDVDIRSDVYALGVILYQLLTGRFPYQVAGKLADVLRNIVEVAPERPSTLRRNINNEIETIVLKALAKEPIRRYQSADAFGGDIQRYLNGEAIEAKRDSGWYVLRKTARQHQAPLSAAAVIMILIAGGLLTFFRHRDQQARASANTILAGFVSQPSTALLNAMGAAGPVATYLHDNIDRYLQSEAYTERVVAARAGIWLDQEGFWESVDGGALWQNGEWLELADIDWPNPDAIIDELDDVAASGTDRQKYVALCLLGWTAPADQRTIDAAKAALESDEHPAVLAAAKWALKRGGQDVAGKDSDAVFVDPLTGMTFVEVAGVDSFLRGSPPSDPARMRNEIYPDQPVSIPTMYVSDTEVTLQAFAEFYETFKDDRDVFSDIAAGRDLEVGSGLPLEYAPTRPGLLEETVCPWISPHAARLFCDWLTQQAAGQSPARRYRLLTEDEWEYAARGGNSGRFCYGDNADYARYFGVLDGVVSDTYGTATRMPNWYGLFDMHGNYWEVCGSRFEPEGILTTGIRLAELWAKRGGAYYSPAVRCRSAQRNYASTTNEDRHTSTRLVVEFLQ